MGALFLPAGLLRSAHFVWWTAFAVILLYPTLAFMVIALQTVSVNAFDSVGDQLWALLLDSYLLGRWGWTMAQASITCVLASLIGVPCGWVLARYEFRGKGLLLRLLLLPLVVPVVVLALALRHSLPFGLSPASGSDGSLGLLLWGNLFYNLPILVRASYEGFARRMQGSIDAAHSLCLPPWAIFFKIEWPSARPWIAASNGIVFLYTISSFGVAWLLGGSRYATIEVEIYTLVAHQLALFEAAVLALLLALIVLCLLLLGLRQASHLQQVAQVLPVDSSRLKTWRDYGALLTVISVLFTLLLWPLLCVLAQALALSTSVTDYSFMAQLPYAAFNTVSSSLGAAVLTVLCALCFVLADPRQKSVNARSTALESSHWRVRCWQLAPFAPLIIAPVVFAWSWLLAYPQWLSHASALMLVIACGLWPLACTQLQAVVRSFPQAEIEAALSLGMNWRLRIRLLYSRWLMPPVMRLLALCSVTALGEFSFNLVLTRPERPTLSTLIATALGRAGGNQLFNAYLASMTLLLCTAACVVLFYALDEQSQRRSKHQAV